MGYLYTDLTYTIIGLCYDTFNQLGPGHREKYYSKAFEMLLNEKNIAYKREVYIPVRFKERIIGKYFVDYLIDKQIILEFKVGNEIKIDYLRQVLSYLKSLKIKIGLIVLFTDKKVIIKRLIV